MNNIEIIQSNYDELKFYINGVEIHGIVDLDYNFRYDEFPTITVEFSVNKVNHREVKLND